MTDEVASYIRLAPTTLFRAPECYGIQPNFDPKVCSICPVHRQCEIGQYAELHPVTRPAA